MLPNKAIINPYVRQKSQKQGKFPNLVRLCCSSHFQYLSQLKEQLSSSQFINYDSQQGTVNFSQIFVGALNQGTGTLIFIGLSKNYQVIGDYYHPVEEEDICRKVRIQWEKVEKKMNASYEIDFVPVEQSFSQVLDVKEKGIYRKLIRIKVKSDKNQVYYLMENGFSVIVVKNKGDLQKKIGQSKYDYILQKWKGKKQKNDDHQCQKLTQKRPCDDVPYPQYENNFILIVLQKGEIRQMIKSSFPELKSFCVQPYLDYQRDTNEQVWFLSFQGNQAIVNQVSERLRQFNITLINIRSRIGQNWNMRRIEIRKEQEKEELIFPYSYEKKTSSRQVEYFSFSRETDSILCYVYFNCFRRRRAIFQ